LEQTKGKGRQYSRTAALPLILGEIQTTPL
jgi:hypothetical protein